jgi:hypothetical protein
MGPQVEDAENGRLELGDFWCLATGELQCVGGHRPCQLYLPDRDEMPRLVRGDAHVDVLGLDASERVSDHRMGRVDGPER